MQCILIILITLIILIILILMNTPAVFSYHLSESKRSRTLFLSLSFSFYFSLSLCLFLSLTFSFSLFLSLFFFPLFLSLSHALALCLSFTFSFSLLSLSPSLAQVSRVVIICSVSMKMLPNHTFYPKLILFYPFSLLCTCFCVMGLRRGFGDLCKAVRTAARACLEPRDARPRTREEKFVSRKVEGCILRRASCLHFVCPLAGQGSRTAGHRTD